MKSYEKHCVDFFRRVQDLMTGLKGGDGRKARILYLLNEAYDETTRRIVRDTIDENKDEA